MGFFKRSAPRYYESNMKEEEIKQEEETPVAEPTEVSTQGNKMLVNPTANQSIDSVTMRLHRIGLAIAHRDKHNIKNEKYYKLKKKQKKLNALLYYLTNED